MTMVAEGVEDEVTAGRLAMSSCDKIQGFFFSKALPADELESWVDRWHALIQPAAPALQLRRLRR